MSRRPVEIVCRVGTALVAGVFLLAPGTAPAIPASTVDFLAPGHGARLRPGEVVTVRWDQLPPGTEEFELLLLLDGSDDTTVRLTVEMDPHRCSYRWRVPNLPSSSARLQIRFSRGGGEERGATSEPFRILPSTAGDLAGLAFHGGEWWPTRPWASSLAPIVPRKTRVTENGDAAWPLEPLGAQTEQDHALTSPPASGGGGLVKPGRWSRTGVRISMTGKPTSIPQRE